MKKLASSAVAATRNIWIEPTRHWLRADRAEVECCLADNLSPLLARAWRELLKSLVTEFLDGAWPGAHDDPPEWAAQGAVRYRLLIFLRYDIQQQTARIRQLRLLQADYSRRFQQAVNETERQRHLLEFARALGASRQQLRGDRRALERWLGLDTLVERSLRRQAACDRHISFALGRLGQISVRLLEQVELVAEYSRLWQHLDLEKLILPLLAHDGDPRVRVAAFHSLALVLRALPTGESRLPIAENTLRYIYGSALDNRQSIWIQIAALDLLDDLDPDSLATVLRTRLSEPGGGDDLFLRRRAALLLGRHLHRYLELAELLPILLNDPAPYVRQGLAEALLTMPLVTALPVWQSLIREDPCPPVRATALLQTEFMLTESSLAALADGVAAALANEQDAFVLRAALRMIVQAQQRLLEDGHSKLAACWLARLGPVIAHLHTESSAIPVRRWAAQTREQLWAAAHPERRQRLQALQQWLAATPLGQFRRLPRTLAKLAEAELGRLLAIATQQDHGCDLIRDWRGWRLIRGQILRFRFWRWLHEFRRPATDKRPAFRHTIGRVYYGNVHAPSGILAELAETKVPGEPLYLETEDDWRPWLPLVDELISALDAWDRRLRRYTSEGVTEIIAPRRLWRRLRARILLSLHFVHYARLRNWREGSQLAPSAYLTALTQLGFVIRLIAYPGEPDLPATRDPQVERFFLTNPEVVTVPAPTPSRPALATPLGQGLAMWPDLNWPGWWERFRDYFFSVYQNSLFDLGVFLIVISGLFFGRHVYAHFRVRRARRQLALAIGGWGTRGKSGTERIKAALMNALGFGVFSKTTGCEAMFLYAPPYGTLRELFLYRPYDKATIWEQTDVLCTSAALHTEVFLWECMGLTPAYVHVLQRQWMRDDLATLTNAYPDHEDVQGPAGYNIPEVMTEFIPERSTLLTSEEQMLPILRSAAERLGTRMSAVGWLEAGLLTPDVLARFPYEEHPYNIALVLRMAREMGVDADFALKEMADRVVMDIGVLKRYPVSQVNGRRLEFINGMSANERFGCLTNWRRMGFDQQEREQHPGLWISTVVNNRADRLPRSQVFASILVNDLSADRHFLIGGNLDGLQGYIRSSWEVWVQDLTLWPTANATGTAEALAILERQARWQRIPTQERLLYDRAQALLAELGVIDAQPPTGFWRDPEGLTAWLAGLELAEAHQLELAAHLREEGQNYENYQALALRITTAASNQRTVLNQEFRTLLWRWFSRKLIVIRDAHVTGEQMIARITQETPPGLYNRVMGIQNIKGPGLDFVYRWQTWESCYRLCQRLRNDDLDVARPALRELSEFPVFGQLEEYELLATIVVARRQRQSEYFQAELALIESRVQKTLDAFRAQLRTYTREDQEHPPLLSRVLSNLEAFLDAGDAVRRRRLANQIYRDLADERIATQRATLELRELVRRQKGGWLERQVRSWLATLRNDRAMS